VTSGQDTGNNVEGSGRGQIYELCRQFWGELRRITTYLTRVARLRVWTKDSPNSKQASSQKGHKVNHAI